MRRIGFAAAIIASLGRLSGVEYISESTFNLYEYLVLFYIPYSLTVLVIAIIHKREDARIMFFGLLLFVIAGGNDLLMDMHVIDSMPMLSMGLFAFVLSDAVVLSLRRNRESRLIEGLSQRLEQSNQELSRMDKLKDEFLAHTSHELRTPLHGIIGIAEGMIQQNPSELSADQEAQIRLQYQSALRLSRLVDDILDFSKLQNRDLSIQPKTVDLHSLANQVLLLARQIGRGQADLHSNIPRDFPRVQADEDRLQQVLLNLVGNAIKYASTGRIEIGAEGLSEEVELWVQDFGPGLTAEEQEKIFLPFEQLGVQAGGTGLGLAISRHLVKLHGSELRVESHLGQGSRFYFRLSLATQDLRPEKTMRAKEQAGQSQGEPELAVEEDWPEQKQYADDDERPLILVVDDEPVNLKIIETQLDREFRLHWARDGLEALQAVAQDPEPDLVLLDWMLPGMSGLEVCRQMRASRNGKEIPIIILTARVQSKDMVVAFAAGANDYVRKPFVAAELRARLYAQLQSRQNYLLQKALSQSQLELEQQRYQENCSRLRAENAELETLRYQLNPHLIFNSLASIRGAIKANPDMARDMVGELASFCSLTLRKGLLEHHSLAEEFEALRKYLNIERLRLGNYLEVVMDCEAEIEKLQVPVFILQPLVDNAVKYGRRSMPDHLVVTVQARREEGEILLVVENTGLWVEPDEKAGTHQVGLGNIRARLTHFFGASASLQIEHDQEHVRVVMHIAQEEIEKDVSLHANGRPY